jgi:hypothetical protein
LHCRRFVSEAIGVVAFLCCHQVATFLCCQEVCHTPLETINGRLHVLFSDGYSLLGG